MIPAPAELRESDTMLRYPPSFKVGNPSFKVSNPSFEIGDAVINTASNFYKWRGWRSVARRTF
jgi:hypothetical protein